MSRITPYANRTEAEAVADKLTQQVIESLTRVAAEPGGLPLYASKSDAGLFPNTAGAKPAAQKCLAEELIHAVGTDAKSKTPRELYALTDKGWEFLLAAVNPKQVLEDFVRVLEARQGEVGELLDTARRMATSLQGLKEAVSRVLPVVESARVERPPHSPRTESPRPEEAFSVAPCGGNPSPVAAALKEHATASREEAGVALLAETNLAPSILAHLADHSGPTDCTLPELYRAAVVLNPAPSIGEFHDCLRLLHADGAVALHSWTGPLYAMPEPQFALLVGHGIAYYASLRH